MADSVGNLAVVISANAKPFEQALATVQDKAAGFASSFGKLAVAGFAGSQAFDFAKWGVQLAAEAETAQIAFEVMLKSADKAKAVLADIRTFAAQTPFQSPELIAGARQLAAYGFSAEQLVPSLKALGDIASGTGQSIGDLVYLVGTLRVQGRAFSKDIYQFTNRGVPVVDALAQSLGKTTAQIMAMVEEGKISFNDVAGALNTMVQQGGSYFGMTERQSKTISGLWSTIKDNAGLAAMNFGEGLINVTGLREVMEHVAKHSNQWSAPMDPNSFWAMMLEQAKKHVRQVGEGLSFITGIKPLETPAAGPSVQGLLPVMNIAERAAVITQGLLDTLRKSGKETHKQFLTPAQQFATRMGELKLELISGAISWEDYQRAAAGAKKTMDEIAHGPFKKLAEEGENVRKGLMTPLEELQFTLGNLESLFLADAIGAETLARASQNAFQKAAQAANLGGPSRLSEALEAGSSAAISAVNRGAAEMRGAQTPTGANIFEALKRQGDEQNRKQGDAVKALQEIRDLMRKNGIGVLAD